MGKGYAMSAAIADAKETIIIKKYANRRLYNTDTSIYVTLEDLYDMVKQGVDFEVRDAKTNEDLTRQVLTQIIFDRESQGTSNLLPINFLKTIIGFYEDASLQQFIPPYLEAAMEAFTRNQEQVTEMFKSAGFGKNPLGSAMGDFNPLQNFEEITKKNMELFESAMRMWGAFGVPGGNNKEKKD